MSKKPSINDYQFSLWENTTHVSISKVQFHQDAIPYIEKAIDNIVSQIEAVRSRGMKMSDLPSCRVPFTIFPHIHKAMLKYTADPGGRKCDFLVLYHKHMPIGLVKQDIPRTTLYCELCGNKPEKKLRLPIYTFWEKLVRVLFKSAFEKDSETYLSCPVHGENFVPKNVTI